MIAHIHCAMSHFLSSVKYIFNYKKTEMEVSKTKKKVEVIINGEPQSVEKDVITYDEVVTFAFPDFPNHPERTYSVTYDRGHGNKPAGILSPGGTVKVKDGMIFKVKHTGQS